MPAATGDKPGGQAVVELLFMFWVWPLCHDLEVEDEHDHQAILVLHWHHIHHTQEAVTYVARERHESLDGLIVFGKSFYPAQVLNMPKVHMVLELGL